MSSPVPMAQANTLWPLSRSWSYLQWLTPEVAESMVASAWSDAQAQRKLFDTMLQTDPDIRAAIRARVMALSLAQWRLSYDNGEITTPQGIAKAAEHLMMGMLYGASAVELLWGKSGELLALEPWPLASIALRNGKAFLLLKGRSPLAADEVKGRVAVVLADAHDPAQAAELRPLVLLWLSRIYLLRDWRRYLERFADPLIIVAPPENITDIDGKPATQALAEAVAQAKASGVLSVPAGTTTDLLNDSRNEASSAFSALWEASTRLLYRGIIGDAEIILAGPDGSRAATEVRYRQLDALAERDAEIIRQALQDAIDAATEGSGIKIKVIYSWSKELTASELADLFFKATQAGIPFDPVEAAKQLGLPLSEGFQELSRILKAARAVPRRGAAAKKELDAFALSQAQRFAARARAHYGAEVKQAAKLGAGGIDALKPSDDPPQGLFEALKEAIYGAILGGFKVDS